MSLSQYVEEKYSSKQVDVYNKLYSCNRKTKPSWKFKKETTVSPLKGYQLDNDLYIYSMDSYNEITNRVYHIFEAGDYQ